MKSADFQNDILVLILHSNKESSFFDNTLYLIFEKIFRCVSLTNFQIPLRFPTSTTTATVHSKYGDWCTCMYIWTPAPPLSFTKLGAVWRNKIQTSNAATIKTDTKRNSKPNNKTQKTQRNDQLTTTTIPTTGWVRWKPESRCRTQPKQPLVKSSIAFNPTANSGMRRSRQHTYTLLDDCALCECTNTMALRRKKGGSISTATINYNGIALGEVGAVRRASFYKCIETLQMVVLFVSLFFGLCFRHFSLFLCLFVTRFYASFSASALRFFHTFLRE